MSKDENSVAEVEKMLPEYRKELDYLNSDSFHEYEQKVEKVTAKVLGALEEIVDDETLKMDPEQLVNAARAMTKARTDIMDSKRKLIETVIKGEIMIKALDKPKDDKGGSSALLDYMNRQNLDGKSSGSSVFEQIDDQEE